jgi:diguanylate cyclase (GGDEF)-like protein
LLADSDKKLPGRRLTIARKLNWKINNKGEVDLKIHEDFSSVEQEELKGIARTVSEIEWLLLVWILLFQVAEQGSDISRSAIGMALFPYGAFILAFHYINFNFRESRWKVAIETWVMIVFITVVLWFTGGLQSPLLNLYLLPVVTSALALGKSATLLGVGLITACFILLGQGAVEPVVLVSNATQPLAQLLPMALVAYITTMFSADIRYGLNKARLLSETDGLTDLYNLRGFSIIMARDFGQAVRHARPLSVLMVDSDNLKTVNNEHGHEAGNELLRLITASMKSQLRINDVPSRFGGDEFVVLLPETGARGAREVAERIRETIAVTPLKLGDKDVFITVSIGIASFPDDGCGIDIIMERADQALYRAKNEGRNRVVSFFHAPDANDERPVARAVAVG